MVAGRHLSTAMALAVIVEVREGADDDIGDLVCEYFGIQMGMSLEQACAAAFG